MADERIYLYHPNSGQSICIGKRYGIRDGYGTSLDQNDMNEFYKRCSENIAKGDWEADYDEFKVLTEGKIPPQNKL